MTNALKTLAAALLLTAAGAAATAHAADTYTLDPSHSQVLYSYNHLGFSTTYGLFSGFTGTATIDAEDMSKSSISIEMPLTTMTTGWADRDTHFKSPDFFNAEASPVVTFKSTSVESTGEKTAKITGDLTIGTTTKPVVLDATLNQMGEHPISKKPWAGFDATTKLVRTEWGLGKFAPYVGDDVDLKISIEMEKTGS